MAFIPNDDNRKFTELYNVQRLTSSSIANDSQVVISTIQRMYATLKGEDLNEGAEEENPAEQKWRRKEPLARRLQPQAAAGILRRRRHRRVPPLDLQPLAPGHRVFRRLPHRPHRHAGQPHLRLLPEERRQRIHPREGRRRQGQRRQRNLPDRDRDHPRRRDAQARATGREARTRNPRQTVGNAGRGTGLRRDPARPLGRQPRPDPHRDPQLPRQVARDLPRPQGTAENADLRQDRQPRRRHHPDRPAGVRRGQRFLPQDHQRREEPEILAQRLPQRLLPAHRRHRRHDRHRHRRQAARMPDLHARREVEELLRTDEGAGHARPETRRPEKGLALGPGQDPLRHRRCRRRDQIAQDRQPAARHQAVDPVQGPRHGPDDGRPVRGNRQLARRPPRAARPQAGCRRSGENHHRGRQTLTAIVRDLFDAIDPDKVEADAKAAGHPEPDDPPCRPRASNGSGRPPTSSPAR
jgi:hypothetical protein